MNLKKNSVKLLAATLGAATLGFVGVTATAHADSIYTVKSGDTLSEISYEYTNTIDNVNSLAQKNNISDVNVIYVGQKLYLSNNGSVTSATSEQVATTPAASSVTSAASSAVASSATSSSASTVASSAVDSSAASSATSTATSTAASSAASSQVASSATSTAQSSSTSTASSTTTTSTTSSTSSSEAAAEAWIVARESGGSYTASNGNYYGKYQLTKSMLNGDLSAANQDKVANAYVASRYGSWVNAKAFWEANGWY